MTMSTAALNPQITHREAIRCLSQIYGASLAITGTGNFNALQIGGVTVGAALAAAAAPVDIPLNQAKVIAAWKDTIADTPGSGILGLIDTEASVLLGNAASGNVKTDEALFIFSLPAWYIAGSPITVRIRGKVATTVSTVSNSLDCTCKVNADGALGSDICATAAQSGVLTTYGDKDFVITPTGRVAGETLHIRVVTIADDTGGTVNTAMSISKVQVLLG